MNIFDRLQQTAQRIVSKSFGYTAIWRPLAGGEYTAEVLFREPTEKEQLSDQDYTAARPRMEYFGEDFPGLFDLVLDKASEQIIINGKTYLTVFAQKTFDGKTITIFLESTNGH